MTLTGNLPDSGKALFPSQLAAQWRQEAEILRKRGALEHAAILESCAKDLEADCREHQLEALTLQQAVTETGLSYSALQKMVAGGALENVGKKHTPRVRRGDLPRKARRVNSGATEPDLAAVVLAHRD